ncbi:hypothetical protein [Streptomyces litchfieldiae]|uniref:Uncharacterized protein n=1 Tax=Streptomyces litchfieldiae TaxID=3075543 RepID=A0ABU2N1J4_9ACTN|nr:hypothetical protein [Streptomyces sp. DSM 44938]MDT0347780.1 hypothetical protein [Streptomyces sp. DSM 44938]
MSDKDTPQSALALPHAPPGPAYGAGMPAALRVSPLRGETAWSYVQRIAARQGMDPGALLGWWTWRNHRPYAEGGGVRADAEIVFNPAGQQVLAEVGGAAAASLARALPSLAPYFAGR